MTIHLIGYSDKKCSLENRLLRSFEVSFRELPFWQQPRQMCNIADDKITMLDNVREFRMNSFLEQAQCFPSTVAQSLRWRMYCCSNAHLPSDAFEPHQAGLTKEYHTSNTATIILSYCNSVQSLTVPKLPVIKVDPMEQTTHKSKNTIQ